MGRRLLSLWAKDLKVVTRNHYLTVVVGLALLYVLAVNFLIPAQLATSVDVVVWDQTGSQAMLRLYEASGDSGPASSNPGAGRVISVDSEAAFSEALGAGNTRLGLKIEGRDLPERIVVTYQGYENQRTRHLFEAALRAQAAALTGSPRPVFETDILRPTQPGERPPFNFSLLPVFIFTEAVMVGVLLTAALLYSEKDEGTLGAYRVSPGGVLEYLLAKSLAMGVLGVVFTVIVTALTVGFRVAWAPILGITFLSAVVMTLVALVVANLFRTISQFLLTGVVITVALGLPVAGYFAPSLSPWWFKVLPSYPLVFALREAYFPSENPAAIVEAAWQMLATLAVVLPLAALAFSRQLVGRDA